MKRKALCFALALLMCMMVAAPAFAESSAETPPSRISVSVSYGLKLVSGSTYKMWAKINNPEAGTISATLTLYNGAHNYIASVSKTSSNTIINLSKNLSLTSGTYYLKLTYTVNGTTYTAEKACSI